MTAGNRRLLLSAALLLGWISAAQAAEFVPVARLQLLGGQFFFEGEHTSFSGNGDWLLTPGLKFSDRWSLIPTLNGKYRRVREVQELIGGGFLTQETLENSAIFKSVYQTGSPWKLKLKGAYKNQLLVESADEKLGKGLFDNHKIGFGVEAERAGRRLRSLRFSFDPYAIRFYHYRSLTSGTQFGSEIDNGENTLDFNAYDGTSALEWLAAPGTLVSAGAQVSYRPFTDQKLVAASGTFLESKRKDWYGELAAGVSQLLPAWGGAELIAGLDGSAALLDSDQSNYDAARTRFNENYYDYSEVHAAPRLGARLGKIEAAAAYDYSVRSYGRRPPQSSDGTYQSGKIWMDTHTLSYSLKYSWTRGLAVLASGVYRRATSNMEFERTYRYNYTAQHYFVGASWEY